MILIIDVASAAVLDSRTEMTKFARRRCYVNRWCVDTRFVATDSVLPCGEEGFDLHPPRQRLQGRRSHQL